MYLYIGLFDWTRWAMFSPPMHKFVKVMNTQKPIICINILIPEPFLTQFLTFFF
jgi:hypothetical protein